MPSQKHIYILLFVASIIGLAIITVRRVSDSSCIYTDKIICNFLKRNKNLVEQKMQGSYELYQEDLLKVTWRNNKNISEIQVYKDDEEMLHTIIASRYVYIQDYADNQWWREQKNTITNTLGGLPFNPEIYFPHLETILTDDRNNYRFIEETACGKEECYRYQVINPEQTPEEQLFVFFSKNNFKLQSIFEVQQEQTGRLHINYENTPIVEPAKTKIVSSGRNIFLEYIELQDKPKPKNFEYLQQFQQDRISAEGESTIPYVENMATEESTLNF
ncbi:MAG TPA: hypothetical protein PLS49_02090 [Candidatus Woesebacteria bacterium]|nr:hypothetical protein [Candidatus Woesebacteria bacterium]